jgi:hypothetical protein
MLFDRPYTRYWTHCGSFELVTLIWPHLRWEWWAIIRLAQWSRWCSTMFWKCLVVTPFGQINCDYVFALLLWGLLLVSTSRYSGKVRRMLIMSTLTFKSASQSCLRIHLVCPTAVMSNLFGPQDCLERCRGGQQVELIPFLGIPLAPTM